MFNPFGFSLEPSKGSCRITKLLICEVLPQHNQYLRPYTVDSSLDVVRQLENVVNQPGNVTPQALATIPAGFLTPSAAVHSQVNIVNGWSEKRFRFILEVLYENNLTSKAEIICGFTDHPGITRDLQHLDPNMVFYINSIVPMIRRVTSTQYGNIEQFLPSHPSHLIGKDTFGENQRNLHVMTPQSVVNQMVMEAYDYGQNIYDMSANALSASFSNRDNTNALRYASKLFTAYKDEIVTDSQSIHGSSERELLSKVRGKTFEQLSTGSDQFINEINGITGDSGRTWFQFKDLMRMDPNVTSDQITTVVMLEPRPIPIEHTMHIAGSDIATQSAVNISNILPSIMLDYGVVSISLVSTNNTIGSVIQTFVTDIRTLSGTSYDLTPIIPVITNRINEELIKIISFNNQVLYDINVTCELVGETTISLSYNNEEHIPYIIPTFADTLFNPIITDSKQHMSNVVNGFNTMFSAINSWVDSNAKHFDFNGIIPYNSPMLNDL